MKACATVAMTVLANVLWIFDMKKYVVDVNDQSFEREAKNALEAVVSVLNELKLRYEYADFTVKEIMTNG